MESLSSEIKTRVLISLRQVADSILMLQEWNRDLTSADDYLLGPEGTKNLAASCMLVEAIGEAFKKIDRDTEGRLLDKYPAIPWRSVKKVFVIG